MPVKCLLITLVIKHEKYFNHKYWMCPAYSLHKYIGAGLKSVSKPLFAVHQEY